MYHWSKVTSFCPQDLSGVLQVFGATVQQTVTFLPCCTNNYFRWLLRYSFVKTILVLVILNRFPHKRPTNKIKSAAISCSPRSPTVDVRLMITDNSASSSSAMFDNGQLKVIKPFNLSFALVCRARRSLRTSVFVAVTVAVFNFLQITAIARILRPVSP